MLKGTDPAWDYVEATLEYSSGLPSQYSLYCHIGHGPCVHGNAPVQSGQAPAVGSAAAILSERDCLTAILLVSDNSPLRESRVYCDEVSI